MSLLISFSVVFAVVVFAVVVFTVVVFAAVVFVSLPVVFFTGFFRQNSFQMVMIYSDLKFKGSSLTFYFSIRRDIP